MKQLTIVVLFIACMTSTPAMLAQNPLSRNTQVEIGLGYIWPNFRKGTELMRSYVSQFDALYVGSSLNV